MKPVFFGAGRIGIYLFRTPRMYDERSMRNHAIIKKQTKRIIDVESIGQNPTSLTAPRAAAADTKHVTTLVRNCAKSFHCSFDRQAPKQIPALRDCIQPPESLAFERPQRELLCFARVQGRTLAGPFAAHQLFTVPESEPPENLTSKLITVECCPSKHNPLVHIHSVVPGIYKNISKR